MAEYRLQRVCGSDKGTFGVLIKDEMTPLCVTCELPWKDNQKKISCIPAGTYKCEPYTSAKYPNVWQVTNVPNRDAILIHAGNTIKDIEGCILVGQSFGTLSGLPAVLVSGQTLARLQDILPDKFNLTIDWPG
jgi:hypothetical protein